LSQGRLAVAGSSLRVDIALAEQKPPTPSGDTVDSAPPATITSASPYSMRRPAWPMQCRPVVQAVTMARLGPCSPYMIENWPEIMLMIEPGTKNGEIRRGPRFMYSVWLSSIIGRPPMPEPIITPTWVRLASVTSSPLSASACAPAASP
jgi:hypothetical protein